MPSNRFSDTAIGEMIANAVETLAARIGAGELTLHARRPQAGAVRLYDAVLDDGSRMEFGISAGGAELSLRLSQPELLDVDFDILHRDGLVRVLMFGHPQRGRAFRADEMPDMIRFMERAREACRDGAAKIALQKESTAPSSSTKKGDGWTRKFKGSDRGGAYIYTHPDARDGRAIVVNGHGVSFDGQPYDDLQAAKDAALSRPANAPGA